MTGAVVLPFRGYIPPADMMNDVICPPYDVVTRDEATAMAKLRPQCLLKVNRPEIELPGVEHTAPAVYDRGAKNLQKWIHDGLLVRHTKPAYYAYRQRLADHVQCGLFAAVSCEQYKTGIIKKHELTRAAPELDRTKTIRAQNANVGSVFLAFKGEEHQNITAYIRNLCTGTPDRTAHLDYDNTDHELWIIDDEKRVNEIQHMFENVPSLYIADGHHRAASACNLYTEKRKEAGDSFTGREPFCFFMAAIFADTELCIIDYNRVVHGLTDPTDVFIDKLREQKFEVSELTGQETPQTPSFLKFHFARPVEPRTFSMYLRGKWYRVAFKGELEGDTPVDAIDSEILTYFVLKPLFNVRDVRSDPNLKFFGGTRGLEALEEAVHDDHLLAFAVPPVKMADIIAVADRNEVMPPKSTWFVPKLATGMVIRVIESDE